MARRRRPLPYQTREQLADAMRAAVLANPNASQHDEMARALGISPRSLYRLRQKFQVPWPPFDDWDQLLRLAGAVEAEAELTAWLVTFTVREQRWITATSLEEAVAKLRAEIGPRAVIISVQPG